jgi:transposase
VTKVELFEDIRKRYFGGVFKRLRYDNLSDAVKKVLRGRRREETNRFIALRSHAPTIVASP